MPVLIYAENTEGQFKKAVLEAVCYAKSVADQLNTSLVALSIGTVAADELESLGKYGIKRVLNVSGDQLKTFVNQAYASVIAEVAEKENAEVIILSNSLSGRGLAARIGAKLKAGVADGATALPQTESGKFIVKKTAFSGRASALVELTSDKKIISLNPNAYPIVQTEGIAVVEDFMPIKEASDFNILVKEILRSTEKVSLPDAEIIVSAGKGLKGPENWKLVEDLAEALGAAIACTKPVSDAGWRPHQEHVGQTGISVSPNLYIAIGISGAIQHLAGVSASKVIVVINKDPEAPFFKVADYGIVGDAFEIIPKLTEAVKNYKMLATS
ncbi:MAG: electron transfer flavoprotein subunit alpha/FixB family protein [Janthinobacterium lividum]